VATTTAAIRTEVTWRSSAVVVADIII